MRTRNEIEFIVNNTRNFIFAISTMFLLLFITVLSAFKGFILLSIILVAGTWLFYRKIFAGSLRKIKFTENYVYCFTVFRLKPDVIEYSGVKEVQIRNFVSAAGDSTSLQIILSGLPSQLHIDINAKDISLIIEFFKNHHPHFVEIAHVKENHPKDLIITFS